MNMTMNTYQIIAQLVQMTLNTDNDAPRLLADYIPHIQQLTTRIEELEERFQELEDDGLSQFEDNITEAVRTLRNALSPLEIPYQLAKDIENAVENCLKN